MSPLFVPRGCYQPTKRAVRSFLLCHAGMVDELSREDELEALVRSLRDEVERLKAEIARLRRDRDERPPHYL